MKLLLSVVILGSTLIATGWGQGAVSFDNVGNQGAADAISGGRFWYYYNGPATLMTNTTLHGMLLGGPLPNDLTILSGPFGGDSSSVLLDCIKPGVYADDSGNSYIVDVPSGGTAYLEVFIWEGTATSLAAAESMGYHSTGTGVFTQTVGGGVGVPASLTGMPSIGFVPEPGPVSFLGLGVLLSAWGRCLWWRGRRGAGSFPGES